MELAWRESAEQQLDMPDHVAAVAGAVGAAAPPGGWGGGSVLVAMAAQGDRSELLGTHWHLPSVFQVQEPNQALTAPAPSSRAPRRTSTPGTPSRRNRPP